MYNFILPDSNRHPGKQEIMQNYIVIYAKSHVVKK